MSPRPLTKSEISFLKKCKCVSSDWSLVFVSSSDPLVATNSSDEPIRDCCFSGRVTIPAYPHGVQIKQHDELGVVICGLYRSTFGDGVVIETDTVSVRDVVYMAHTFIRSGAVVAQCGRIYGTGSECLISPMAIEVGPETGGRVVECSWNSNFASLCLHALSYPSSNQIAFCDADMVVIYEGATLLRCDEVVSSWIGASSTVIASTVSYTFICSDSSSTSSRSSQPSGVSPSKARSTQPTGISSSKAPFVQGSFVSKCILQRDSRVTDGCHVQGCIVMEHASISLHARVSSSIIGPDASISGGECHHSLLGSMVGFHHQSLLIGALWPLGRGNMAYGSMVGANHTGRLPDQESHIGEGVFFGLGVTVKYPLNLFESPYSIVAAGTSLLPQKVTFPFSLICTTDTPIDAALKLSPALNQIKPAWVLYGNPYLLERSESKFVSRGKAKEHNTKFPVIRVSTILLMMTSVCILQGDMGDASSDCKEEEEEEEEAAVASFE